jgi:hypothetical protein
MITTAVLLLLALLQIKHWYIDFVNQTTEEVNSKGKYGDGPGIDHSAKHGIGTMVCVIIACGLPYIAFAAVLGFIDFVFHYHIDWTKMNFGNRDITTPAFWNHLGLDQMAHQLVYLGLAYLIT